MKGPSQPQHTIKVRPLRGGSCWEVLEALRAREQGEACSSSLDLTVDPLLSLEITVAGLAASGQEAG